MEMIDRINLWIHVIGQVDEELEIHQREKYEKLFPHNSDEDYQDFRDSQNTTASYRFDQMLKGCYGTIIQNSSKDSAEVQLSKIVNFYNSNKQIKYWALVYLIECLSIDNLEHTEAYIYFTKRKNDIKNPPVRIIHESYDWQVDEAKIEILYKGLGDHKFIQFIHYRNFKDAFTKKSIPLSETINWKSTLNSLCYFIDQLREQNLILDYNIWATLNRTFTFKGNAINEDGRTKYKIKGTAKIKGSEIIDQILLYVKGE